MGSEALKCRCRCLPYLSNYHGWPVCWLRLWHRRNLGRWSAYAKDGHGGNKLLEDLIATDPAYPAAFSYSLLQILPKTFARSEVLEWEQQYKTKLGSQATGLNASERKGSSGDV